MARRRFVGIAAAPLREEDEGRWAICKSKE
jgi:hypothetical protein